MSARKPSIKTLSAVFSDPAAARAVFEMSRAELLAHPAGADRDRECSRAPETWDLRMHVLNSLDSGLYGIESIETAARDNGYSANEYAEYLNTGDSYAPTVIYWRGNYRVQSIGDFIECSRVVFA